MKIIVSGVCWKGMSKSERARLFNEWANMDCQYYPSVESAESHLPFSFRLPECKLTGPVKAVYIRKDQSDPESNSAIILFTHGIEGISLTVCQDLFHADPGFKKLVLKVDAYAKYESLKRFKTGIRFRRHIGKNMRMAKSDLLPTIIRVGNCSIRIFGRTELTPLAAVWSKDGLMYSLLNGWDEYEMTLSEFREIIQCWIMQ